MRRIVYMLAALLLCLSLAAPAYAAEEFVPSISYKDGPSVQSAVLKPQPSAEGETEDAEQVDACLIVTSIIAAQENTTDIHQEERDQLLELYEVLSDGSMKLFGSSGEISEETMTMLFGGKDYVIMELVDVSFEADGCIGQAHDHQEHIDQVDTEIAVDFKLGVSADTSVVVLVFHDEKWEVVENVTNKGDGTVTCVFENIGPVAFCVEAEPTVPAVAPVAPSAPTAAPAAEEGGDEMMMFWLAILLVCLLLLVLVVLRRKGKDKSNPKEKKNGQDKK